MLFPQGIPVIVLLKTAGPAAESGGASEVTQTFA
jgi:hypothetical protein